MLVSKADYRRNCIYQAAHRHSKNEVLVELGLLYCGLHPLYFYRPRSMVNYFHGIWRKLKGKGTWGFVCGNFLFAKLCCRHGLHPSLIHNDHTTHLFCIAAPIDYNKSQAGKEEENWREGNDLTVWTMGQDRHILNTKLGASREVIISYPTIGAPIQCMVTSPLDPNRYYIFFS